MTETGTITAGSPTTNCPHLTWRGTVCSVNVLFLDLPTALYNMGVSVNTAVSP